MIWVARRTQMRFKQFWTPFPTPRFCHGSGGRDPALWDRVLAELDSAHDYYTDTKIAWRLVHKIIAAGDKFTVRNPTTGTVRTQTDLADKARGYIAEQLTEATFQQFISTFENFFFDLLRCWLTAYPQSLGGKQVDFKTVLDSPDKETVTQLVVTKELNEVFYDRPARWFAYLRDKANLDCPSAGEIERIAEAKACAICSFTIGGLPAGRMKRKREVSRDSKMGKGSISPNDTIGKPGSLFASWFPTFRTRPSPKPSDAAPSAWTN